MGGGPGGGAERTSPRAAFRVLLWGHLSLVFSGWLEPFTCLTHRRVCSHSSATLTFTPPCPHQCIVSVAGGATRAALTMHQARRNNMADVSAKDGSQVRARHEGGGRGGRRPGHSLGV